MCGALAHLVCGGLLIVGWWLLGVEEYWYETYKVVKNNTYLWWLGVYTLTIKDEKDEYEA